MADDEIRMALAEWLGEAEKPRGRYMADVRHPLKARRLDDRPSLVGGPRPAYVPQVSVPDLAPCSKCGEAVTMSKWWRHSCLATKED